MKLFEEDTPAAEVLDDPFKDAPDLDFFRKMYREFHRATEECRKLSLRDSAYYHGFDQLSAEVRAELLSRRQPPAYFNKIRPAIQGVLGLIDSNETNPEAVGRNGEDEDAAQVVTQVLRYLKDACSFDGVKQGASHDYLVFGTQASTVEVDDQGRPASIYLPWRELFYDPQSLYHDFRDAKYMGKSTWWDADVARRKFPDAKKRLGDIADSTFAGSGVEDQPVLADLWRSRDRKRVRIVENYYRDDATGRWKQAIYCHAGLLHWSDSPYLDDDGQTVCPIQAVSFEVDDQGQRYGMIRDMVPLQDMINNNWSKQTHALNTVRVEIIPNAEAQPGNKEEARRQAQRPDGVMPEGYKTVPLDDRFQGATAMLERAERGLDRMAPSPSLLGRAGGANESGKARQLLQQAGFTELSRALGRFEEWELRNYRHLWFRAAQYMTDEQVILVTDDAGARQKITLNRIQYEPQTQQGIDPMTGQLIEQTVMVEVGREQELARMTMDVTLKTVRQADTLRGEGAQRLLEYCGQAGIDLMSRNVEIAIYALDLPNKAMLRDFIRKMRAEQSEEQAHAAEQQAQQAQQLQTVNEAATQSKIMRDQAQAGKDQALADKHGVEAQSEQLDLAIKAAMLDSLGPL